MIKDDTTTRSSVPSSPEDDEEEVADVVGADGDVVAAADADAVASASEWPFDVEPLAPPAAKAAFVSLPKTQRAPSVEPATFCTHHTLT